LEMDSDLLFSLSVLRTRISVTAWSSAPNQSPEARGNRNGGVRDGINVLTALDAIDYAKSDYVKFSDGKRILAFKKYAFRVDAVAGKHIFKIKDERRRYAFVSEEFVDAVNNNGLEGFRLEEVWDSTTYST